MKIILNIAEQIFITQRIVVMQIISLSPLIEEVIKIFLNAESRKIYFKICHQKQPKLHLNINFVNYFIIVGLLGIYTHLVICL